MTAFSWSPFALGWGADVPTTVVTQCPQHPGQEHRLAGLKLLEFRSHCLTDDELLDFCSEASATFAIRCGCSHRVLHRDGSAISERLAGLCRLASDGVADAALRAQLYRHPRQPASSSELSQTLEDEPRRQTACQKLNEQFRA